MPAGFAQEHDHDHDHAPRIETTEAGPGDPALEAAIFDELCQGIFQDKTTQRFVDAIAGLQARGADCVILGCTEIPLIVTAGNSPLPVVDSTRLLAKYAVATALEDGPVRARNGWIAA